MTDVSMILTATCPDAVYWQWNPSALYKIDIQYILRYFHHSPSIAGKLNFSLMSEAASPSPPPEIRLSCGQICPRQKH